MFPLLPTLQEGGCPDINIICERITVGGLPTRFEDQTRLPMGVSVNSTSYSAKLLQVRRRSAPPAVGCSLYFTLCPCLCGLCQR
jgi:hypothetical protein